MQDSTNNHHLNQLILFWHNLRSFALHRTFVCKIFPFLAHVDNRNRGLHHTCTYKSCISMSEPVKTYHKVLFLPILLIFFPSFDLPSLPIIRLSTHYQAIPHFWCVGFIFMNLWIVKNTSQYLCSMKRCM